LINYGVASLRFYLPTKNLRGQTIIITGASTGIRRVCALRLPRDGSV